MPELIAYLHLFQTWASWSIYVFKVVCNESSGLICCIININLIYSKVKQLYVCTAQLQSAWAGYYDYNTLDQNAIIGEHPVISNLIFANGFSGHGIQQSPAVGRAVSEIILDGHSHSIDLSGFSYGRIINNQPFKEKNII